MNNDFYHKSVLVKEVVHYLNPQPNQIYVDATFGAGGHSRAILQAEPNCKIIAIDWDKQAIEQNAPKLQEEFGDRIELLWGNFARLTQLLKKINIKKVDGILADFGTSQYQIANLPGFSFYKDSPLDMRMSPGHYKVTAYEIVNRASEDELTKIFQRYGQERNARKIAREIVRSRSEYGPLRTTRDLAKLIEKITPGWRQSRIHPATRVFQALRIVVNDELNNIKSLLTQSLDLLALSGRIVCISFHSLEDSIVKDFFRLHSNILQTLTPRVITASKEELEENLSARSAKLRAAIKIS